jgi:hypothetical protein
MIFSPSMSKATGETGDMVPIMDGSAEGVRDSVLDAFFLAIEYFPLMRTGILVKRPFERKSNTGR